VYSGGARRGRVPFPTASVDFSTEQPPSNLIFLGAAPLKTARISATKDANRARIGAENCAPWAAFVVETGGVSRRTLKGQNNKGSRAATARFSKFSSAPGDSESVETARQFLGRRDAKTPRVFSGARAGFEKKRKRTLGQAATAKTRLAVRAVLLESGETLADCAAASSGETEILTRFPGPDDVRSIAIAPLGTAAAVNRGGALLFRHSGVFDLELATLDGAARESLARVNATAAAVAHSCAGGTG
jgi:hypothetical protein